MHVVGKMSKDIGMGVCKSILWCRSFLLCLVTLFGDSIPMSVHFFEMFFVTCFHCFFLGGGGGGGGRRYVMPDTHVCATQVIGSDDS